MSILIFGATGRIGQHLIMQLKNASVPVRAVVRNVEKAIWIQENGVELVWGDMRDPASLKHALKDVEKIFLVSKEHPQQVTLQRNVITAARHAGVKHLVKISAIGATADSPMVVGRWHAETEREVCESGLPFTFIRPNFFMQNISLYRKDIIQEGKFYAPMGNANVALVDAHDIAAVAATALLESGHEGKIYEVSGPESLTFNQVAESFSLLLNRAITYVDIPVTRAREDLQTLGLPDWHVDSILEDYQFFREGNGSKVSDTVFQVTRKPANSFDNFIRQYAATFPALSR